MSFIDSVFGNSAQVLSLRAQRSEMITSNLAHADTPGYKATDINFESALAAASGRGVSQGGLNQTHGRHFATEGVNASSAMSGSNFEKSYRVPTQARLDGNTVETDVERMAFTENAIRYQAAINFLDGRIKSVVSALRGE